MLPTYVLVLIALANTLQMLAYLKPRRPQSVALGVALFLLPLILRRWTFGGTGEHIDMPFRVLAYVFYAYGILHLFVVDESLRRVLFSGLGIISIALVFVLVLDVALPAASPLTQAEVIVPNRLIYCGLVVLCWPLLRRYVREPFRDVLDALDGQRWYFVFTGQLAIATLGNGLLGLTQRYDGLHVTVVAVAGVLSIVFFYIAIYLLIRRERANQFLRTETAAAEQLVSAYAFYGQELAQKEEDVRRLRHDFRHTVGYLAYLAKSGNMAEIEAVMRSMGVPDAETEATAHCENTIVNAVVASCFAQARASGVRCNASLQLPRETGISDVELAIIFGNALENCMKGALSSGAAGWIELKAKSERGYLIIRFENSYEPNGYKKGSGFGLMSIQRLCKKYDGSLRVEANASENDEGIEADVGETHDGKSREGSERIHRITLLLQPPVIGR